MAYDTRIDDASIESAYQAVADRYSAFGVDATAAIEKALSIPISLHCWQGDDVGGFETKHD